MSFVLFVAKTRTPPPRSPERRSGVRPGQECPYSARPHHHQQPTRPLTSNLSGGGVIFFLVANSLRLRVGNTFPIAYYCSSRFHHDISPLDLRLWDLYFVNDGFRCSSDLWVCSLPFRYLLRRMNFHKQTRRICRLTESCKRRIESWINFDRKPNAANNFKLVGWPWKNRRSKPKFS